GASGRARRGFGPEPRLLRPSGSICSSGRARRSRPSRRTACCTGSTSRQPRMPSRPGSASSAGRVSQRNREGRTMDSVVHFEMPYDDRERMAKFYRSAFGWQTQMLGQDMNNYVLAVTTETGDAGPKNPGAINGGFCQRKPDYPMQYPSVVIAV